ncbi:MAG: ribonuclease E/G [Terricaulis silvestris]
MSEQLETWIDASVGETREALVRDGRAIALRVLRASENGAKARWGELYVARVTEVDRRRRGAFVDLGLSLDRGFLPLDSEGRARRGGDAVALTQGMSVIVSVAREAARGKNPVLQLVELGPAGETPRRLAQHDCDLDLAQAKPADAETRLKLDEAFDAALARSVAIPGGGTLSIEPTAALVAIDVDAGGRGGSGDPERFALELNLAAAKEVARQLRLRSLGGLAAIDFVSMRAKSHRMQLEQAVRDAFTGDPWSVQFGALSRFGVFELSRAQLRTPLHEVMLDTDRKLSVESVALQALRAIEREAEAARGRQIAASVSAEVRAWLDAATFDWRGALNNRIGTRWSLDAHNGPREKIDVRAL